MSFAKELLVKLLRKFVKGVTSELLTLRHMFSGTVELGPGVCFQEEAVQQALMEAGGPINWEIKSMTADSVTINIPWVELTRRSTRVSMGELKMEILLHNVDDVDACLFGFDADDVRSASEFLRKQRNRLLAMAAKRRSKLDTARARKRGLADFAKVGLWMSIGKIKMTFLRVATAPTSKSSSSFATSFDSQVYHEEFSEEVDCGLSPPPLKLVSVLVWDKVSFSPCNVDGRPTLELRQALAEEAPGEGIPHLPSTLRVWSVRLIARAEALHVWMPEIGDGSLRRVITARHWSFRTRIFEAANTEGHFLESASGRFLGFWRSLEVGMAAQRSASGMFAGCGKDDEPAEVHFDLKEDEFLTLVELHAEYKAAEAMLIRWRHQQPWKPKCEASDTSQEPSQAANDIQSGTATSPSETQVEGAEQISAEKTLVEEDEQDGEFEDVEELLRESRQSFIAHVKTVKETRSMRAPSVRVKTTNAQVTSLSSQEMDAAINSQESVRRYQTQTTTNSIKVSVMSALKPLRRAACRSSSSSAVPSTPAGSGSEQVLLRGWLLKKGHVRPLMDPWQDRWCELSQAKYAQGGVFRYHAKESTATASSVNEDGIPYSFRGEIALTPDCGAQVRSFDECADEEVAQHRGSVFRRSTKRGSGVRREFPHGFELIAGEGSQQGRVFYFALHERADVQRWVEAIRMLLTPTGVSGTIEGFIGHTESQTLRFTPAQSEDLQAFHGEGSEQISAALEEAMGSCGPPSPTEASPSESSNSFLSAASQDAIEEGPYGEQDDVESDAGAGATDELRERKPSMHPLNSILPKDLASWADLNTRETLRLQCPSITLKIVFNATGSFTIKSSPSRSSGQQLHGTTGVKLRIQGMDTTLKSHRPQALPECLALARLCHAPVSQVLACLHPKLQLERFGPSPSIYRGRSVGCITDGVAALIEMSQLESDAPLLQTVGPGGNEGAYAGIRGHMEEAFGVIQKINAQLHGWKMQCSQQAMSQCLLPMKSVMERAARIMKEAKGKNPSTHPAPSGGPAISIQLQDWDVDATGVSGRRIRVRLPGQMEVDSLQSLVDCVSPAQPV